ncbi:cytidylyltransferase domain-containing protein [Kiloniella sp.]|uniref:cytidylyltransferase domain-containing protein n=1 Tax=Kiloniella sp. TaxID=1938587 RepID=UPI003A91CC5B
MHSEKRTKQNRRLVAALACRAGGTRLFGKPLQTLDQGISILDHILEEMKAAIEIDAIVLGISEGIENQIFIDVANRHDIGYILGDQKDVLQRLIQCGHHESASDVFRITSECPFTSWEMLPAVWKEHTNNNNDITVTEFLPEGLNFEIYSLASLEKSHKEGNDDERSEFCSAYARRCHDKFNIQVIPCQENWNRLDLRLTVDNPEDLILCRAIFKNLKNTKPHIPTEEILKFVDRHPKLHRLVEPFVDMTPLWAHCQKETFPHEK